MLFSRASCATLTPGCIDCSTMAILKSRGSWGVVVVCGRQGFHRSRDDGKNGRFSGCLLVKALIQNFGVDSWRQRPGETGLPEANKEIAGRGFGDTQPAPGLNTRQLFIKMEAKRLKEPCPVFHAIVSIKNDGHYFPGTGARCTDGLNVTLTHECSLKIS